MRQTNGSPNKPGLLPRLTLLPLRQRRLEDSCGRLSHDAAVVYALDPGAAFFAHGGERRSPHRRPPRGSAPARPRREHPRRLDHRVRPHAFFPGSLGRDHDCGSFVSWLGGGRASKAGSATASVSKARSPSPANTPPKSVSEGPSACSARADHCERGPSIGIGSDIGRFWGRPGF